MIDHDGDTHVYIQLADVIAERITSGVLRPRRPIPSEAQLVQEFGVARETVRKAVSILRDRGLVYTVPARGSFVRDTGHDVVVTMDADEITVTCRPPTEAEQAQLEIGPDDPVVVVYQRGRAEVYAAGTVIRIKRAPQAE
ncbi:GntR family transcriptional regulator [Microbispora sp. NPDC088329]|uniref:GntR family transcriptional regulator n=1 Tax=Microbispora sp. NPDC088329 TaxID=3154869 RepID=UPI00341A1EF9